MSPSSSTSSSESSPESSRAVSAQDQALHNAWKDATAEDVLDDLSSRFILNLPQEEQTVERICFQVEQAHWYYEDFIRESNPRFPSMPLKRFSEDLFSHCPSLTHWRSSHEEAYQHFIQAKISVPVCGAIMLNATMDKCVLVKGWKSSSGWGFPKGKINQAEEPVTCAVREVLEETGYNLEGQINKDHVIEVIIKQQAVFLFVVSGVPENFPFETKTRKEISKIEWFNLSDLPNWKRTKASPGKFYLISPFIGPLKAFINEHKPRSTSRRTPRLKKVSAHRHDAVLSAIDLASSDTAQESSSQSSDPLTPSPHYTELVARVADDTTEKGTEGQAIDPHLARLLSGLVLGAKSDDSSPQKQAPAITNAQPVSNGLLPALGSSPVFPATPSSNDLRKSTAPPHLSTHITVPKNHAAPLSAPLHQVDATHHSIPQPALYSRHSSFDIRQPMGQNGLAAIRHTPHTLSPSGSVSTVQLPPASPGVQRARRMSNTADISPYLSRPQGVPTSARQLKQLALLESVAAQSERMTPQPQPLPTHQSWAPPPPSVGTNDLRVIYSSDPAAPPLPASTSFSHTLPNMNHLPPPPRPYSVLDDPFTLRPPPFSRARFAPVHPNQSMEQNQLLALMNGRSSSVLPNPHVLPPFVPAHRGYGSMDVRSQFPPLHPAPNTYAGPPLPPLTTAPTFGNIPQTVSDGGLLSLLNSASVSRPQ